MNIKEAEVISWNIDELWSAYLQIIEEMYDSRSIRSRNILNIQEQENELKNDSKQRKRSVHDTERRNKQYMVLRSKLDNSPNNITTSISSNKQNHKQMEDSRTAISNMSKSNRTRSKPTNIYNNSNNVRTRNTESKHSNDNIGRNKRKRAKRPRKIIQEKTIRL